MGGQGMGGLRNNIIKEYKGMNRIILIDKF